jgi:histidyl-tRNA synthetase
MSNKIQSPTGTEDLLPVDAPKWHAVENIARETAHQFGFGEIRTPVFEHTELFHRGVGETSDVVHKETYTFTDRGDRSITLRPEGTAGVARAVVEHGLLDAPGSTFKCYYIGSNFRYERKQKGRLRIHHQFGAEAFGVAAPEQDVECILLQMAFYQRVGLREMKLMVNSLGDRPSKQAFRDALVKFLEPKKDLLSPDSQRRLVENPLRILDSKVPGDIEACQGAPDPQSCLSEKSKKHFDRVRELLTAREVPYEVNPNLVRGFDYYTDTLWEVQAAGLGAQSAVGGGGRYDNLVELIGGKPTPGVGFGSGIERLLIALEEQKVALPIARIRKVFVVSQSPAAKDAAFLLVQELRDHHIAADADLTGRNVASQFKLADAQGASVAVVLGENELSTHTAAVKNLATREQQSVARGELVNHLKQLLSV